MHEITDANRPFPQGLACLSRDAGTTMVSWACQEGRIHPIKGAQSHLELFSGEEGGGQWLYITSPHLDLISIFWVHHLLFDHRYELLEWFFFWGGYQLCWSFSAVVLAKAVTQKWNISDGRKHTTSGHGHFDWISQFMCRWQFITNKTAVVGRNLSFEFSISA